MTNLALIAAEVRKWTVTQVEKSFKRFYRGTVLSKIGAFDHLEI